MYEKMTFGSFDAKSSFNLVTESSVNCNLFFLGSKILVECPTAIIVASVAGVTMYIRVRPCRIVLVNKFHMT